jgi:UDP-N-acetylmuramate dehydrogenase
MANILRDHLLKPYCTFQIGGPADFFAEVSSEKQLLEVLKWREANIKTPIFIFGAGSNLLFESDGFRGLVIRMKGGDVKVLSASGNSDSDSGEQSAVLIQADAGVSVAELVMKAYQENLTGLEPWNGLPGTVGGAVFGNAGCFGLETRDFLISARVWDSGEIKEVGPDFFRYKYRHSRLREELLSEDIAASSPIILSATFRLEKGIQVDILAEMKRIAGIRKGKQPPGLNTGSFFKNPDLLEGQPFEGKSAGWLIEQAGLKGFEMSSVDPENPMRVSAHHGNFFMNGGGARSEHVDALAAYVIKTVKEWSGIELEREVIAVSGGPLL